MNAAGILRVGIFTLIFSTTLIAETIPFDYWYGRIIGGQHFTVDYFDSKNGLSNYSLSYTGGMKNAFQLNVPNIVRWTPNSRYEKTDWTNPTMSGALQLSGSTRYSLDLLEVRLDDYISSGDNFRSGFDSQSYTWNQSVVHLDGGGVNFNPEASLYYYLNGIWLSPRQVFVKMSANLQVYDYDSQSQSLSANGGRDLGWSNTRRRAIEANVQLRNGISKKLNFGITAEFNDSLWRRRGSSSYAFPDEVPSKSELSLFYENMPVTNVELSPYASWLAKPTLWIDLGVNAVLRREDRDYHYKRSMSTDSLAPIPMTENTAHSIEGLTLRASGTWLSKKQTIETLRICDNFQNYFGNQLSPHTVRLDASLEYSGLGDTNERWLEYYGGPIRSSGTVSIRSLIGTASPSYYLSRNISVGASSLFSKRVYTSTSRLAYHEQRLQIAFNSVFRNYHWDANERRDISWAEVSDIDYLLGALLRPGDMRIAMEVLPPPSSSGGSSTQRGFWRFFPLDFGKNWHISAAAAAGILSGTEIDVKLEYFSEYSTPSDSGPRWIIAPEAKYQPFTWLRMAASLSNVYYKWTDYIWYPSSEDYQRTWTIDLRVDCVF